jgi:hypothetical protein
VHGDPQLGTSQPPPPSDFDIDGRPYFDFMDCTCGSLTEDDLPSYAIIRGGVYLGLRIRPLGDSPWSTGRGIVDTTLVLESNRACPSLALTIKQIVRADSGEPATSWDNEADAALVRGWRPTS